MPGPLPKPQERRQRTNERDMGLVRSPERPEVPEPAARWRAEVKEAWADYWGSELVALIKPETDLPPLRRLFNFYDDQARYAEAERDQPFITGSKGQPVANPAGEKVLKLEPLIRALEDRFGITPLARLKLGVTFAGAASSLDELNRSLSYADDEGEEPDLRVIDAESA